jgi:hypothetical protein
MPTLTRYLTFANPPNDFYQTQAQAEAAASEKAKKDEGQVYQVWEVVATRKSTVEAEKVVTITPDP